MVYEDLKENHEGAFAIPIKAHELRGVSASLARMVDSSNNFSTKQIVDSVGWKSQNSFLSFYFKDLTPSLWGLQSVKSLVVAGKEVKV